MSFIIKEKTAAKGEEQKIISIPGTTFTIPQLIVDFEYTRRVGGKVLEITSQHFQDSTLVDKYQPINTNVKTISVYITKQDKGIIITSTSLKEKIILPATEFSINDDFVRAQLIEIYKLMGYECSEI